MKKKNPTSSQTRDEVKQQRSDQRFSTTVQLTVPSQRETQRHLLTQDEDEELFQILRKPFPIMPCSLNFFFFKSSSSVNTCRPLSQRGAVLFGLPWPSPVSDSGTFQSSCRPFSYSPFRTFLTSSLPPLRLSSRYFLYSCSAVRASSMLSCVSPWMLRSVEAERKNIEYLFVHLYELLAPIPWLY